MDNPSRRIIDFWFNYAARSIKFILQPVSKWTGTRKISRADSFCKNFEIFVCLKLKSCCFREDMRYDFRFSFFGSFRFLVATATICLKNSVNSSYKTSLYEVQNNKFTFPKKVFGSKFCIIWSQKKLWKKRKSRNWEATVDSKMCFLLSRMAIPMIFAVLYPLKSTISLNFTLWKLVILNGVFGFRFVNSKKKQWAWRRS